MKGKFIYVFDLNARDRLLAENYHLLKADEDKNVFVFENKGTLSFSAKTTEKATNEFEFVLSDTLTF